ncbi:endonuclease/exonuclease/phosphatase family protein [Psychroflexus sediminis]|uniref:Uncharacterized conserved protein YafD, endonuclease/exonuclease/phosphatase (EEP) superfamily n=1 Tax=Psychroflexus sediminis TaxID=470826 RepID=A0A1G7XBX9_9FLAO|nr:endonuclease/exonuclease/phosphatase family protein [Psychroflexus sediminis]SDG81613.1 Uncharacterized conserved protein YafD, endonuclease/exonuclease/phosphatase (EEP) superfamily [Psychroflexus sediminis]
MKTPFFKTLLWMAIAVVTAASVLPNIFPDYWLIDLFAHFKVQYFFIAILLLIASTFVLARKKSAYLLLLISILWNSYYIAPYYLHTPPERPENKRTFKLTSLNLLSTNPRADLVRDYVENENPDILVLLEFTQEWEKELGAVISDYPYRKLVSRTDNFGIAVVSKFEMKSSVDYFGLTKHPSVIAHISIENTAYTLVATHPVPPVNQRAFQHRNRQLTTILNRTSEFENPLIILGDFNTSSFSNHFRTLLQNGMKDSRMGFGLLPTWPAGYKLLQTTLDHALVSKTVKVLNRTTGQPVGSDHLPISILMAID